MPFFEPEFRPRFALRDARIDVLADYSGADAPYSFEPLAVVGEAVGCYGFGTVFVCGDGLGGESGRVVEFFVVSPVVAASGGRS